VNLESFLAVNADGVNMHCGRPPQVMRCSTITPFGAFDAGRVSSTTSFAVCISCETVLSRRCRNPATASFLHIIVTVGHCQSGCEEPVVARNSRHTFYASTRTMSAPQVVSRMFATGYAGV
jgi:hypothetical protein